MSTFVVDTLTGNCGNAPSFTYPAPQEPDLLHRALELQGYIAELEDQQNLMRGHLFGEGQGAPPPGNQSANLESILADVCTRAACLVGAAKTINGRLNRK